MDKLTFEILSILKKRYNTVRPHTKYQVEVIDKKASARQFYTATLDDNLYVPMSKKTLCQFRCGSGNELKDKMLALRSSSAMTYNILGNNDVKLNGTIYENRFEWQHKTLKTSSTPANLDALLSSDNEEIIACEMKMLEWLPDTYSQIKNAYLDENNYFDETSANTFIPVIKSLINNPNTYKNPVSDMFSCRFNHYDAFQMIKHCLALYNACNNGDLKCKKLTLLNCVWELPTTCSLSAELQKKYTDALNAEHKGFKDFYSSITPIKELFAECGINFDIVYQNAIDFIGSLDLDDIHKDYLKRYTF